MDGKERKRRNKSNKNQGEGEGPRKGRGEMRQDEAPLIDETRLREALRRNKFCIGVKRGNGYRCGGETNEDAKSKAVELLNEAVRRIWRWRVWDSWWVEETMDEWLIARDRLEIQLRGKYSEGVVNAVTGLVNKFINYNEEFLNYWREVSNEVEKLVDDLLSGRAEVIIWEGEKGVSVHGSYVTLNVHKTNTDGVVVHLVLNGLGGMIVEVPDVFRKTMSRKEYERFIRKVLMALKGGLEEADGTIEKGKAAIGTTQTWQVIVWSLLYPGEVHMYINSINVNDGDVTIKWRLRSSHKPLKGKILSNVDKLGKVGILAFTFTAVLGDGWVDVERLIINGRAYDEAVIEIAMSGEKYKAWKQLFERLKNMGFRSGKPNLINDNEVEVKFYGSNAINLSRAMMAVLPPILRDVLDALAFEKWVNLRRIAEMEVRWRKGEMQITIANIKFTVVVRKGTVELERKVKDNAEVGEVIDALRAVYGDELAKYVRINKSGRYLAVKISMNVFERYSDIKAQVIEVLCRKLEKTKDEKKRQEIIKHLKQLTPTKGAAAVECSEEPTQAKPRQTPSNPKA